MPQAAAGSWRSHAMLSLYGRGSLHKELLEATIRTRQRADTKNDGERFRLKVLARTLDRRQKVEVTRKTTEMAEVRRAAEDMAAYREVLKSFTADKLWTLRWGFRPDQVRPTPESSQRYQLENRLYRRGYSVDTLYPEVVKAMQERKPEKRRRKMDVKLLGDFSRVTTDAAVKQDSPESNDCLSRRSSISTQQRIGVINGPKPLPLERSSPLPLIKSFHRTRRAPAVYFSEEIRKTIPCRQRSPESDELTQLGSSSRKPLPSILRQSTPHQVFRIEEPPATEEGCRPELNSRSSSKLSQSLRPYSTN